MNETKDRTQFVDMRNIKEGIEMTFYEDGERITKICNVFDWYFVISKKDYLLNKDKLNVVANCIVKVVLTPKWAKIFCTTRRNDVILLCKSLGIKTYEADLNNARRVWLDNVSKLNWHVAKPEIFKILYFDIETDDTNFGLEIGRSRILSIATKDKEGNETFHSIKECGSEEKLLLKFLEIIKPYDIIVGWNSFNFDIPYIKARLSKLKMNPYIKTPHIDMMTRMQHAFRFDTKIKGYALDYIASRFLNDKKITHTEKIIDMYNNDFEKFKAYNKKDVDILYRLDKQTKLLSTLLNQAYWCNTFIRDIGPKGKGLYIMLDNLILTKAHQMGEYGPSPILDRDTWKRIYNDHVELFSAIKKEFKAMQLKINDYVEPAYVGKVNICKFNSKIEELKETHSSLYALIDKYNKETNAYFYEGGFVIEPNAGKYKRIYSFDYKSLYPTTIISSNIGFDTLVDQPSDDEKRTLIYNPAKTWFRKDKKSILNIVVTELMEHRKQFKADILKLTAEQKTGTIEYETAHSAEVVVKELSNSLYGIMGNRTGRYFSIGSKIPSSVTLMGQQMIKMGQEFAESKGYTVIYGDSVTYDSCVPVKINGQIKIVQMNELYNIFKSTKNILTLTKEGNWKRIKRVIRHLSSKTIYDIIQPYGFISVTKDHGFYSENKLRSALEFSEKIDYDKELKLDTVKTKLSFSNSITSIHIKEINTDIQINKDLAIVIGAYIAKGSMTKRNDKIDSCRLACGTDLEYINKVNDAAIRVFGKEHVSLQLYDDHGYVSLIKKQVDYSEIFEKWCGYKSENKKLPDWILDTNKEFFEEVLYNYQLGNRCKWNISTDFSTGSINGKSRKLISQLWFILSTCYDNYYLKFKFYGLNNKRLCNRNRHRYGIFWTDLNRALTRDKRCIDRKYRRQSYRIVHSKKTDGYVYDIEVEDDHTFVECIGMVPMHNTDSLMISTPIEIDPDAYLDEYHNWLTNALKSRYNIDNHVYELEFDRLYSPYILINKKTYTGLVLNQEHKTTNYVYSRGLDIVKSSSIKLASKLQEEIIDLLLHTDNDAEFYKEFIVKKRDTIFNNITAEDIAIGQKINKNFDEYKNKPLAVIIAERKLKHEGGLSNNRIEYIITGRNGSKLEGIEPDEFKGEFDKAHYWNNIILPCCRRLLEAVFKEIDWRVYEIESLEDKNRHEKKEQLAAKREANKRLLEEKRIARAKAKQEKKDKAFLKKEQLKLIDI